LNDGGVRNSGGQFPAALLAAALDDQPSGMSRHAGKETDPAFPTPIRGLKSSLHLRFFLLFTDLYAGPRQTLTAR
jgi:hypothetical protein